jgi:integrase
MNEDEVHTFLEFAKTMPYYALFYLILYTALRRSEILALRWCDIDRLMGEVSVTVPCTACVMAASSSGPRRPAEHADW